MLRSLRLYTYIQGANEIVPIDSEDSGKWGLGGNEGAMKVITFIAPSFPK